MIELGSPELAALRALWRLEVASLSDVFWNLAEVRDVSFLDVARVLAYLECYGYIEYRYTSKNELDAVKFPLPDRGVDVSDASGVSNVSGEFSRQQVLYRPLVSGIDAAIQIIQQIIDTIYQGDVVALVDRILLDRSLPDVSRQILREAAASYSIQNDLPRSSWIECGRHKFLAAVAAERDAHAMSGDVWDAYSQTRAWEAVLSESVQDQVCAVAASVAATHNLRFSPELWGEVWESELLRHMVGMLAPRLMEAAYDTYAGVVRAGRSDEAALQAATSQFWRMCADTVAGAAWTVALSRQINRTGVYELPRPMAAEKISVVVAGRPTMWLDLESLYLRQCLTIALRSTDPPG